MKKNWAAKHFNLVLLFIFHFWIYLNYYNDVRGVIPYALILIIELLLVCNTAILQVKLGQKIFYLWPLLFLFIFAYLWGILNSDGSAVDVDRNADFVICLMILSGVYLLKEDPKDIFRLFDSILVVSCIISIYELVFFDYSRLSALMVDRSALWDVSLYRCGPFFWLVPFYIIHAFIFKRGYIIAIVSWLIAMLINAIATKRAFIVESGWVVLLMFVYFVKTKQVKEMRYMLWIMAISFVGVLFLLSVSVIDLNTLFEAQSQRLSSDGMEATGFARFEESINYFSKAGLIDVLFGKGLGVAHHGLGGPNTALHIGFTNLILKFGVFLVLPYLLLQLRTIRNFAAINKKSIDKFQVFCILCSIECIPVFFVLGNYWVQSPHTSFFVFFLIKAAMPIRNNGNASIRQTVQPV